MKKLMFLTGSGFALLFCMAFTNAQQNPLRKQLIGEWRNIYMKIVIPPGKNLGITMEADSANWEATLKIKPIRTHFNDDGSYYSEYRNLKDSLVRKVAGTWWLKADTIIMSQMTPDKSGTRLQISITGNVATFSGMIDFDGKGISNVSYLGKQRKYK